MERSRVADVGVGAVAEWAVDLVFWSAVLVAGGESVDAAGMAARSWTGVDGFSGVQFDAGLFADGRILGCVGVSEF